MASRISCMGGSYPSVASGGQRPVARVAGLETASSKGARGERGYHLEIFMISFAALLLEIAYTRVISFKLFYYYTYLVIGLALLGIGAGGVLVAVSKRLQRAGTESILMLGSLFGAI